MSLIFTRTSDQILTITLNRPEKYNSFTEQMALQLQEALKEAESEDIRCVVLKANGKAFCGGQDLNEVVNRAKNEEGYELSDTVRTSYNPIVRAIRNLPKPVICAVQGTAAGAGANIAFACDVVIASNEAVLIQAFSKIGLIPDSGGTFFLPRLIGFARTNALYLLDEKISGEEAVEIGLIYKAVESDQFESKVELIAKKIGFYAYESVWNL